MRITVCELPNEPDDLVDAWSSLVKHVADNKSDLLLLPEMPFYRWVAGSETVDPAEWDRSVAAHDQWIGRLKALAPATVIASRPVVEAGVRRNVGFVWEADTGAVDVHAKYYLPDEPGFWEASWYARGDGDFSVAQTSHGRVGFLICTELWFTSHAREYGRGGAQIIVCPRATPTSTAAKWLAGGRTAAVVSGAFCLSSNFSGPAADEGHFAGLGWIIEPDEGEVLGHTSSVDPFLTVEVDLATADMAKTTYPRYVSD